MRATPTTLIALLIALVALAPLGCDGGEAVNSTNNAGGGAEEEVEPTPTDDHGHGYDPETEGAERIETGFLSGSWRVARVEDDAPVGYFDITHDQGATEADGHYTMGNGLYDPLDGETGELATVSYTGDRLTVTWNPTTDQTDMMTLVADAVDDNTLEGSITSNNNPNLDMAVQVTRSQTADSGQQ